LRTPAVSAVRGGTGARRRGTLVVLAAAPGRRPRRRAAPCAIDDVVIVGAVRCGAALAAAVNGRVGVSGGRGRRHRRVRYLATGRAVRRSLVATGVRDAVGSHEPHARELDEVLMRRAHVVVEGAATALRGQATSFAPGWAPTD
jgi:hypothetical protein